MISHKQQQQLLLLLLLIIINKTEVRKAVPSFPVGSSGGPDGLRPRHLRDLIQCRESGGDFLSALTAFVKLIWCWLDAIHLKPCVFFLWRQTLGTEEKQAGSAPSPLVSPRVAWLQSAPVLAMQVGYLHTSARGSLVWGFLSDAKRPFILPVVIWRRYHLTMSL